VSVYVAAYNVDVEGWVVVVETSVWVVGGPPVPAELVVDAFSLVTELFGEVEHAASATRHTTTDPAAATRVRRTCADLSSNLYSS
jgi:hypothetical protein